MTTRVAGEIRPPEPPPEASQPGAVVWLRKNLFGSAGSTITTLVLLVLVVLGAKGMIGWALSPDRLWDVIPRNVTNYVMGAYPRSNITRMWVSLDILLFLAGVSMAVWRPTGRISPLRISAGARSLGIVLLLVALFAPSTFGARGVVGIVGIVLVAAAFGVTRGMGDRVSDDMISTLSLMTSGAVLLIVVVWLLPVASTTKVPLTVALAVAVVAHLVGRWLTGVVSARTLRPVVTTAWLVSLPVIYLHVQRSPEIDWSLVAGDWLPWVAAVAIVGGALIAVIGRSDRERAGVINAVVVLVAIGVWAVSAPMVARMLLLLLAVFTLATPTFGSSDTARRRILVVWIALVLFFTYLFAVGAAETGLETRNEYFGGFNLTVMLAAAALLLSFPLGIVLALGRTSTMPIFRLMSTGYIELVRGVPLITVLFIFRFGILNFLPAGLNLDANVLVLVGLTLFSAAYLAENIRGGLQSIPKGQYEAAKALGMSTAQMTMLITLPQALRAVIPAIVGQVITLFKDTSLVAIVGLAEFFRVVRDIVPNQPTSLGSIVENLLFAAVVYWIFTFNFSRASQRLERKLGVGTR